METEANVHLRRGELLFRQSRLDLAEGEFRAALAQEPNQGSAHSYLAMCLAHRRAFSEALAAAQQGVALDANEPFAHFALAHVLLDLDRPKEAAISADEAIRLAPWSASFRAQRAAVHVHERQFEAALETARAG